MVTEARAGMGGQEAFDAVKRIQQGWREAGRGVGVLRKLGQSVELPQAASSRIYDFALNNLPSYVTQSDPGIVDRLRATHPVPIIAFSLIADERSVDDSLGNGAKLEVPSDIRGKEDEKAWKDGVNLLTEVATERTAGDIISGQYGYSHRLNSLRFRHMHLVSYGRSMGELDWIVGKDRSWDFREALVKSHLTGDNSYLETQMQRLGWGNFNDGVKLVGKKTTPLHSINRTRLNLSLNAAGFVSLDQPGILNVPVGIPLAHSLVAYEAFFTGMVGMAKRMPLALDALLVSAKQAYKGYFSATYIPRVLIHEMVHYLALDADRAGFMPLKSK